MKFGEFFRQFFKKDVFSWALFDFANSSHVTMILSFVFPIYFKEIIAGAQYGDFYWGLIGSLSVLLAGFVSPVIGAVADYDSRKKIKFIWCVLLSVVATALLFFSSSGTLIFASLVFIASNFFLLLSQSLYDSFLSHVSTKKNAGSISGFGYALGYLGGIVTMLLMKPLYVNGYGGEYELLYKLTFALTALFFLIFSIPAFIYFKDKGKKNNKSESLWELSKIGFRNTFLAFKEFRKEKHLAWFLVAFYFMNDALVTIFAFISLYGVGTLNLTMSQMGLIFIILQVIAFPSSILCGWFADKFGQRRILLFTLFIWVVITLLLTFAHTWSTFLIIAVLTGLVLGGSQSVARSWFSNIVPDKKRFVLFGFNSFASKISAAIGPVLFGAVSSFTGNQRLAMFVLVPFFVISWIIFYNIKEE
ncbi:MAG: MFS transporter [Nanoarchaeota archaeon]